MKRTVARQVGKVRIGGARPSLCKSHHIGRLKDPQAGGEVVEEALKKRRRHIPYLPTYLHTMTRRLDFQQIPTYLHPRPP